ncbi:MAG: hypothetical protein ACC628_15745 [Pirellulaceae bacterium]
MKANFIVGTLVAAATLSATVAFAQSDRYDRRPTGPIYSPSWAMDHASTYEEGVLRGSADVWRALGEFHYNNSLAAINYQEATRLSLENHKQFVKDYFEKKEINRAARFGDQSSRPTQADLARHAKDRLPERLATYEYHRSLGELSWPAVFQGSEFAEERTAVDRAIADRTVENSGTGSANYVELMNLTGQLKTKLRGVVDRMSSAESIAARKFLERVAYEARFPLSLDVAGLASR